MRCAWFDSVALQNIVIAGGELYIKSIIIAHFVLSKNVDAVIWLYHSWFKNVIIKQLVWTFDCETNAKVVRARSHEMSHSLTSVGSSLYDIASRNHLVIYCSPGADVFTEAFAELLHVDHKSDIWYSCEYGTRRHVVMLEYSFSNSNFVTYVMSGHKRYALDYNRPHCA